MNLHQFDESEYKPNDDDDDRQRETTYDSWLFQQSQNRIPDVSEIRGKDFSGKFWSFHPMRESCRQ